MFTTFSSVPFSPSPANVLQEVQNILDAHDITFGTLIANALRDTTVPLGTTVVSDLENILEGLRPHLDEDEKARRLLGQFFASIVSPEFLRFEKCDGEMSWKLPTTTLSTEQLMGFSLEEMGKRFASDAPGLLSFLGGICRGKSVEQAVVYSTLPQEYSTLTFGREVVASGGGVEERSEVMYCIERRTYIYYKVHNGHSCIA